MGSSPSVQKGLRQKQTSINKSKDPGENSDKFLHNSSLNRDDKEVQNVERVSQELKGTAYLKLLSNMAETADQNEALESRKISQKNVDYEKLRAKDKEMTSPKANSERALDEESELSESIKSEMLCVEVKRPKEKCLQVIRLLKSAFEKEDEDRSSVVRLLHELSKAYIGIETLRPDIYRVVGNSIMDFLIDNNVDDYIYEMAIEILPKACKRKSKSKVSQIDRVSLIVIFNSLINFTDVSDRICSRVCEKTEFLEVMTESLAYHAVVMGTWDTNDGSFTNNVLGVLYNCSCWYANRQHLRDAGLIWILKRIIDLDDLDMKLTATLALAGILDEEESKFFKSETQAMEEMSKLLGLAMQEPERRCEGWSAQELAAACSRLAGNDVNKALLVNAGILDHLAEMCESGNEQEKTEALGAIWALAFDETNRDKMVEEGTVVELIIKLKDSTAESVRTQAGNILWTLREELAESSNKLFQQTANEVVPKISHSSEELSSNTKHVMISYNWGSKVTVFKIHEGLERNGFRVWIDRNEMKGSIVDSIAEGVENAEVLLMCVSPKYKNSKYCRAEAEYAFTNDIDIVPLLLESEYKADGWLGLIKGAKKHFDFSNDDYFSGTFQALVKDLGIRGKAKIKMEPQIIPEISPVLQTNPPAFSGDVIDSGHGIRVSRPISQVAEWSCDQVQKWLQDNQCRGPSLKNFTGTELLFLKSLRDEAPEYFYNYLDTKLRIRDLKQLSKLVEALKRL
ncbi:uncharacterized protein LOC135463752 [Liolophura sinensis]|uniref:uncharacterized protein LOC135463752 n=1 Tax=Liolophura sinensis TaxID=3198878 RepID=UPI003158DF65